MISALANTIEHFFETVKFKLFSSYLTCSIYSSIWISYADTELFQAQNFFISVIRYINFKTW